MKSILVFVSVAFLALAPTTAFAGGQSEAGGSATSSARGVISTFVSIAPQAYFVKTIGGDRVSVHALVPPGAEPATYDPTPRQISMLSQARIYFAIGLPFEAVLIPKIRSSMRNVTVVDTQADVPLRTFAQDLEGRPKDATGTDPHIWLAPELVKIQGAAMEKALISVDPQGAAAYSSGLAKLDAQMDALHKKIAAMFGGLQGRSFLVFHPAFGYFAAEFGLRQVSIEEEGKSPGPQQLAAIIAEAKKMKITTVFVEPQFDQSRAKVIADSIGARVVSLDPLSEDYVANLTTVAERIRAAIE